MFAEMIGEEPTEIIFPNNMNTLILTNIVWSKHVIQH